jgi:hypothetical protein
LSVIAKKLLVAWHHLQCQIEQPIEQRANIDQLCWRRILLWHHCGFTFENAAALGQMVAVRMRNRGVCVCGVDSTTLVFVAVRDLPTFRIARPHQLHPEHGRRTAAR